MMQFLFKYHITLQSTMSQSPSNLLVADDSVYTLTYYVYPNLSSKVWQEQTSMTAMLRNKVLKWMTSKNYI